MQWQANYKNKYYGGENTVIKVSAKDYGGTKDRTFSVGSEGGEDVWLSG